MKILAIETATEACSVALYLDGVIKEEFRLAPREHSMIILPMIESILADSALSLQQLDALAFGCGPGSFTGLRIAAGVIQGLAFGGELPVVPVSTLAAISLQARDRFGGDYFFPAFDARMDEVYWGVYQATADGLVEKALPEQVCKASLVSCPAGISGVAIGSAWAIHREQLEAAIGKQTIKAMEADCLPRAGEIARLGAAGFKNNQAVPAEQAQPVYLRNKVAKKKGEQ